MCCLQAVSALFTPFGWSKGGRGGNLINMKGENSAGANAGL